ncbi:MAG: arylamine N-acetyltransferase [Tatlockia sp.]|nr:arylamine N-acetyltransferase [Tatlockia sp.]
MADIKLYLEYIGLLTQVNSASIELLNEVVTAHLAKFPYQNTDLFLQGLLEIPKRTLPDLSIDTILNQFVIEKRSGYCFQNNELLAWALEELGFKVNRCLVKPLIQLRNKINEELFEKIEFSHEVLIVELIGDKWLIDTGFADYSLRKPLKVIEGEQDLLDDKYNLTLNKNILRLETYTNKGWLCLADIDITPKSAHEIGLATQNFFITEQTFRIRDDYYKIASVTPTKRKVICMFKDTHIGFFKSYSRDTYKEKEINTGTELQELASKKFGIKVDKMIMSTVFKSS